MVKPRKKKAKKPARRMTRALKQEVKDAIYEKVLKAALSKDATALRQVSMPEKQMVEREAELVFEMEIESLKGETLSSRAGRNANYLLRHLKSDKRYISYLKGLIKKEAFYRDKAEQEFKGVLTEENINRIKASHQKIINFVESAIKVVKGQAGKPRQRRH